MKLKMIKKSFRLGPIFILFLGLFNSPLSRASEEAILKTAGQFSFQLKKNQVVGQVNPGYHFNEKAPHKMVLQDQSLKPVVLKQTEVRYQIPNHLSGNAEIQTYVCDDANTLCEIHKIKLDIKLKNKNFEAAEFIHDDLPKALKIASEQNKLIFLEAGATWCPPCIRLESEVFNSKEFKNATKDYVLLKIDGDREENESSLKKYNIKAYPTLLILNSKGEELDRVLDFLNSKLLSVRLEKTQKANPLNQAELLRKAQSGDLKSQLTMAENLYKAMDYLEAVKWYKESKNTSLINYYAAQIEALSEAKSTQPEKKSELLTWLNQAIQKFPNHSKAIAWGIQLAETLDLETEKDAKKVALLQARDRASMWIQEAKTRIPLAIKSGDLVELEDLALPEFYADLGKIQKELELEEESKKSLEMAIAETLKINPSVSKPTHILYLISYLKKIKTKNEIEPWYEKLEKAFPKEFTYFYRHANYLYEIKQSESALAMASKAKALSFGKNAKLVDKLIEKINKDTGPSTTVN